MSLAKTQDDTNIRVDDFLFGLFIAPFKDPSINAKWPRCTGILEKGLDEMKKYIEETAVRIDNQWYCRETSAPHDDVSAAARTLLDWLLEKRHDFLKYECKIRLQRVSGNKAELAKRIMVHIEEHSGNTTYLIPGRVDINALDANQSRTRTLLPSALAVTTQAKNASDS